VKKKTSSHYQASKLSNLYVDTRFGVYYARSTNAAGKDVWRSLGTKSFEVAKARLPAKLAEIQAGNARRLYSQEVETFRDAAEIYRGRVNAGVRIEESSKHYRRQTINALLRSSGFGARKPSTITSDECLEWASRYRKTGGRSGKEISGHRFNSTVDSLREIFDIVREAGLLAENPAAKVGKVEVRPKKLQLPRRADFHRLVASIREAGGWCSLAVADLVEFLAYTGCRVGEARWVRWSDIEDGEIRIYADHAKRKRSRSIPISASLRDLLDRLSIPNGKQPRGKRHGEDFVLQVGEGYKAIAAACERIGIGKMTHHDLRHMFITRCIEVGIDIPTISRWVGHKDGGALLMRTYGHLRSEHSKAMAAKLTF
jgi:integrase